MGGPPSRSRVWQRNGAITNGGDFSVSIVANPDGTQAGRENSHYRSTLEVTGMLPGTYTYIVNNRATANSGDRRASFTVEGMDGLVSRCIVCIMNITQVVILVI